MDEAHSKKDLSRKKQRTEKTTSSKVEKSAKSLQLMGTGTPASAAKTTSMSSIDPSQRDHAFKIFSAETDNVSRGITLSESQFAIEALERLLKYETDDNRRKEAIDTLRKHTFDMCDTMSRDRKSLDMTSSVPGTGGGFSGGGGFGGGGGGGKGVEMLNMVQGNLIMFSAPVFKGDKVGDKMSLEPPPLIGEDGFEANPWDNDVHMEYYRVFEEGSEWEILGTASDFEKCGGTRLRHTSGTGSKTQWIEKCVFVHECVALAR